MMADFGERRSGTVHKRRLRAVFAADVANFSGMVSVSETRGFSTVSQLLKIGCEELAHYEGKLVSMPGDGLFALFESAVDALHCALAVQERLSQLPDAAGMLLRIGIHLGEVLFEGDVPFGETLNIAARLESLADPGGILVSAAVVAAVASRVSATFQERGVPRLKNIPRRIPTFSVQPATSGHLDTQGSDFHEPLDHTMRFSRRLLSTPPPVRLEAVTLPPSPARREPAQRVSDTAEDAVIVTAVPAVPAVTVTPSQPGPSPSATAPPGTTVAATAPPPTDGLALSPERTAAIVEALSVHLGPVARVLVLRRAKTARSLPGLVLDLAAEIPSHEERRAFCARLADLSRP